jgi:hypothetical protein
MKSQLAIQDIKKSSALPASIFSQHAAVQAGADHTAQPDPASALTGARFAQDFSRVAVQSPVSATRSGTTQSCALTPRICPFGGACHTCPARAPAK